MPILIFNDEIVADTALTEIKIFVKHSTQLGSEDNWPAKEEHEELFYVAAPDLGFNSSIMGQVGETTTLPSVAYERAIQDQLSVAKSAGLSIYDGFVKQLLVGGVNASPDVGEFWIYVTPLALALKEGFLDIALGVIAEYKVTPEIDRPGGSIATDVLLDTLTGTITYVKSLA